jgi:hypothetical protein
MTPSIAWLNVTNSATSLLMISAKIRSAVPIRCSPPLSAIRRRHLGPSEGFEKKKGQIWSSFSSFFVNSQFSSRYFELNP